MNIKATITFYFHFYFNQCSKENLNLDYLYEYPYRDSYDFTKSFNIQELNIDTSLKNDIISWNDDIVSFYNKSLIKYIGPAYNDKGLYFSRKLYIEFIEDFIKNNLSYINYRVRYYYMNLNQDNNSNYKYTLIKYIPNTLKDIDASRI